MEQSEKMDLQNEQTPWSALSDRELLSLILITENHTAKACTASMDALLAEFKDFRNLRNLTFAALEQREGFSQGDKLRLLAVIEVARRIYRKADLPKTIHTPEDAAVLLQQQTLWQEQEMLQILLLNTKHMLLGIHTVALGGLNSLAVQPREVFRPAVEKNAAAIILAHNHPSNQLQPSIEDKRMTKALVDAGTILGIMVLDHIIIGAGDEYFSFVQAGLL